MSIYIYILSISIYLYLEVADGELEGMLDRKHAWVSTTKKAANRLEGITNCSSRGEAFHVIS